MIDRRKLLLSPGDAQFNQYNSYSAVDVNVTLLVRADLRSIKVTSLLAHGLLCFQR